MTSGEERQAPVIAFLEDPATHGGAAVTRISTHGAHVFLAGDCAFKLKRAVKLPFLDFSTVGKRQQMLETELALNQPSAPQIYLDVRPVRISPSGRLHFGDGGPVVDWVLAMRRFPQEALLDNLAVAGKLSGPIVDAIAGMVAGMHRAARTVRSPVAASFKRAALDNVRALRAVDLPADLVTRLDQALTLSTDALAGHLDQRAAAGFVRHCHGDLHLGNMILLDGKPTPFDALEFDPALAIGDTFYDLAFVLMDLDHRGLHPLANRLLNRYLQITDDLEGLRALPLFLGVRAAVRAKVAAISASQAGDNPARAAAKEAAISYATLAMACLAPVAPCLLGAGGMSGTGKSALALALAPSVGQRPGALVLRSDVARKRLFQVTETTRLPKASYTPAASAAVYQRLLDDARRGLATGWSVIVDAVFAKASERAALQEVGRTAGVKFLGLWLDAPLATRLARVEARAGDASDADAAVVRAQQDYDLADMTWETCNAGGTPDETLEHAVSIISRDIPPRSS